MEWNNQKGHVWLYCDTALTVRGKKSRSYKTNLGWEWGIDDENDSDNKNQIFYSNPLSPQLSFHF